MKRLGTKMHVLLPFGHAWRVDASCSNFSVSEGARAPEPIHRGSAQLSQDLAVHRSSALVVMLSA